MDERTEDYAAAVRVWVWSGFYSAEEISEMLSEQVADEEDEVDEALLHGLVAQELATKKQAEITWPPVTDCDRLDQALTDLDKLGIICLQNAGYTMSDGLDDVDEALANRPGAVIKGYCFYHGQDLERAVEGLGLWLAFGSLTDEAISKKLLGQQVQVAMQEVGLVVEWNGDPESHIQLPYIDWKRRYTN